MKCPAEPTVGNVGGGPTRPSSWITTDELCGEREITGEEGEAPRSLSLQHGLPASVSACEGCGLPSPASGDIPAPLANRSLSSFPPENKALLASVSPGL